MTYMRLKKQEGILLFKDIIFSKIALDFLHNSDVEGLLVGKSNVTSKTHDLPSDGELSRASLP